MSRISRQKEKYGRGSELFFNNYTEGTAARTRPLSYDEIMANRKNKELSRDVKEGAGEAEKKLRKDVVEDGSDHFESTRGYKHSRDSLSSVVKHVSEEDILKEKTSMKEDDLNKGKYKAGRESDPKKLKGKLDSDMSSNKIRGGRSDNRGHGRRKDDECLSDDSASDYEKKHSKDSFGKVTDMSNKSKGGRSDKRGHGRRKDDAHLSDDSESDSKKKYSKNSLGKETDMSNKSKGGRSYKRGHGRRKDDERLSDDFESDFERKHSKKFLGKETDMSNKSKGGRSDKRGHGRRKDDERLSDDSKSDSEKKHSKNSLGKETYTERSREKSEKESKRKYRCGDDEKIRSRNAVKKHDSGKWHDLEFSDRRERGESPQSRYEESRLKRRRSRSREREKDRKSISPLPKTHNHTSYLVREHGELPSHSLKDRSGRQHSDVDRSGRQHSDVDKNKIADNGLSIRRHGGFASGLGGYSPRKRRTEAGVRTPSPPSRSPEKKSIGWDLPPAKTDGLFSGSVLTNSQSSNQPVLSNVHELVSPVPVASSTGNPLSEASLKSLSTNNNASLDSIQLTQATRTMRRLYVENVPASASEKAVMECLNSFLLSSGVNYIQGTLPCISCIIHKEKGQALVEFITPEDASAALSLDGCCLSGSILKIRRPKDFVDVATGAPEKSVAVVGAISDIVKDSPHKIFIGGISKSLSTEMFIEIASAFGPLKAYRFHVFEDLNEPCAFLEYVDQSVTLKACSGLNGMKLGGQILTAVQAVPNASSLENTGNLPFYGIPEHAKPLLEAPTQVLKLKNVFNPEGFSSLSESEVEEVLEDIRLECARFGNVKAVKVVKYENSCTTNPESDKATDDMGSSGAPHDAKCKENNETVQVTDHDTFSRVDGEITEENSSNDDKPAAGDPTKDESCEPNQIDSNMAVENPIAQNNSDAITQELPNQPESPKVESKVNEDNMGEQELNSITLDNMGEQELNSEEDKGVRLQEIESHAAIENKDARVCDLEPSCVVVEYRRMEASCAAAHCLHGRLFDDRIVSVEYVDLDLYRVRFPK